MKGKKLVALLVMLMCILLGASGIIVPNTVEAAPAVTKIKIPNKMTVYVGKKKKLKVTPTPKSAKPKIQWKTSNEKVATVSKKGVVKGVKKGKATITATVKGNKKIKKVKCKVTVKNVLIKTITSGNVTLKVGSTTTLKPTIQPANATIKKLKYTSGNTKVVTVNETTGLVTAKAAGTATITIAATDGSKKTAKVNITVNPADPIKATGMSVAQSAVSMNIGGTAQIEATVTPANTANKIVSYTSYDPEIATVTDGGLITAISEGRAEIEIKTTDGSDKKAKVVVTVKSSATSEDIKATGISAAQSAVSMNIGGTTQIEATVMPANTTNKEVSYISYDPEIATVSSGGLITAISEGRAEIEIKTTDGSEKTTKVVVTVKSSTTSEVVKATGVSVETPSFSMGVGEDRVLNAIVTPADATNNEVSYTSYDPEIATVSSSGLITALKEGRAEIEIKTTDGSNKTAKAVVTVKPILATSISVGALDVGLEAGNTSQINVIFNPANTTGKGLSYVSSDTSVATVSATGLITAVKNGTATITVTTKDGSDKTATLNVVVNPTSATSMTVSVAKPKIEMGEKIQIQSSITPANTSIKSLKYTLINPLLDDAEALTAEAYDGYHAATISDTGLIEGIRRGPALIRVETVDGSDIAKLVRFNVDWKASDKTGMRIFSTNDAEKDDLQSFRRFLLYTNEMDIEAIILSSSNYHAAGMPERVIDGVTYPPIAARSWLPEKWINEQTAQYEEGYPNLVVHDPNYPTPDAIRAAIAMGNVGYSGEVEASTDGSLMIKEAMLDDNPRKVQFQVWGGTNTFARALMDIEEDYFEQGTWTGLNLTTGTYTNAVYTRGEFKFKDGNGNNDPAKWAEWEAVVEKVNDKAVLYIIMGQDICYASYVEKYWPGITSIFDNHVWSSMAYQSLNQGSYYYNWGYRGEFLNKHITSGHGSLLGNYIQYGDNKILDNHGDNAQDGRWNKAEDPSYTPWTFIDEYGVERKAQKNTNLSRGDMMSEGDSPSFIFTLDRGLRTQENPTWGGWSGRMGKGDRPTEFTDGGYDYCPTPFRPLDDSIAHAAQNPWGWQRRHSASRWVGPLQTDFAVRADWFITPNYEGANHMPNIKIVEGVDLEAVAGQRVLLNARTSDPDGDRVDIKWWHYGEADTYKERSKDGVLADGSANGRSAAPEMIKVVPGGQSAYSAAVFIPSDAQPGDTIHIIAEATDNGAERGKDHNLKYYQRVVIKVTDACPVSLTPTNPVISGGEWNADTQTFTFNGTGTNFRQAFSATTGYGNINVGTGFGATTTVDGSSDTSVFTVTGSGTTATVTPVGAGTATLNATMTINGRNSVVSIRIRVVPPELTDIEASAAKQEILVGESTSINVAPVPSDAVLLPGSYTYKSSNELAAKVSDTGVVTGLAKGPSTITVTAPDGKTTEVVVDVEWKNWKDKPRIIVTTDGEVDDQDSFKRMLYYANELDIEAIVHTGSQYHYAGDLEQGGTIKPFRWNGLQWVYNDIDSYEKIYKNLTVHDPDFPTPDYLRSVYKVGDITNVGAMETSTEGTDFIKECILKDDPRPMYLTAWGGTNAIARALLEIELDYREPGTFTGTGTSRRYNSGPLKPGVTEEEWEAVKKAIEDKVTVYIILGQDNTYAAYVNHVWNLQTVFDSGSFWRFAYQWNSTSSYDGKKLEADWMKENIKFGHGPLLESYYTIGDGLLMPGEPDNEQRGLESYATGANKTRNKYAFISEGDSPSYFMALDRGLRNQEDWSYGGWNGRFGPGNSDNEVRDSSAYDWNSSITTPAYSYQYGFERWFNDIQDEFGARADWGITSRYEDANHLPSLTVTDGIDRTAAPGERVFMNAVTSDPDGDNVSVEWWNYWEADTYKTKDVNGDVAGRTQDGGSGKEGVPLSINGSTSKMAFVTIPADAQEGDTIHIVCTATDSGTHNLKVYQRVIITVEGEIGATINLPGDVTDYWSAADKTYYTAGTGGTTNAQRTFTAKLAGSSTNLPTGNPNANNPRTVAFTSSNTSVATITTAGVITPVGNGTTKITATVSYISGPSIATSVYIKVAAPSVSGITLAAPQSVNLEAVPLGENVTLTATVVPDKAKQTITWSSSDTNIATVNSSGRVTPVAAGSVTITATATDGSDAAGKIDLKIVGKKAASLNVEIPKTELVMGETVQIDASVSPSDASDKTLKYTSSDPYAATVSDTGFVTALAKGSTTITVETVDGSKLKKEIDLTIDYDLENNPKARTIVTSDGEADDKNSLRRLMLYANEMDLEGFVLSSSQYHWAGDPEKGIEAQGWHGIEKCVNDLIEQYEKIYENLRSHDPDFPTPNYYRDKCVDGNIKWLSEMDGATEGSNLIKEAILDDDPRQLYLQAWGGPNTIAMALKSIEDDYKSSNHPDYSDAEWNAAKATDFDWIAYRDGISEKITMYLILEQDTTYRDYIAPTWPNIEMIIDGGNFWRFAYQWKSNTAQDSVKLGAEWHINNIKFGHGPLLDQYFLMGDGTYLDDYPDIYQRGLEQYLIDNPQYARYDFVSEGDSPAFFYLLDRGLGSLEDPSYGGWGGRFGVGTQAADANRKVYRNNVRDYNPNRNNNAGETQYTLTRWINDIQSDFAARADWCITPNFEDVNHMPNLTIQEGLDITAAPGEVLMLRAEATDPDGDRVEIEWQNYCEAGTYKYKTQSVGGITQPVPVNIVGANSKTVKVTIPEDAKSGDTIHIIAQATDDGEHNLKYYQRVIITVDGRQEIEEMSIKASNAVVEAGNVVYANMTNAERTLAVEFNLDITGKTITWSSSDDTIATVNSSNRITIPSTSPGGAVTITATANDGSGKTATINLTIVVPITSIGLAVPESMDPSNIPVSGGNVTLMATVQPALATYGDALVWESSDTGVATVTADGEVIPVAAGNVTITARAPAQNGSNVSGTIDLTIVP